MTAQDLGSEFARAILGIVSARSDVGKAEIKEAARVLKGITPSPITQVPTVGKLPPRRSERSQSDGELLRMLEWDTAPRRWMPSSMKDSSRAMGVALVPRRLPNAGSPADSCRNAGLARAAIFRGVAVPSSSR